MSKTLLKGLALCCCMFAIIGVGIAGVYVPNQFI